MKTNGKIKYKVYQNDECDWYYEKVDEDTSLLSILIFMLIMFAVIGVFIWIITL